MKKPAFYLLASVIAMQLVMVAGVLSACFAYQDKRCDGNKSAELLTLITTQAFALYAAEK